MQALLELDCIPSGMELFPAASEDQWSLIKRVIDDCDYYIVITGGRYGSIGPEGKSYTEMEYRYALEKNKPIMGFIHRSPESLPQNKCETTDVGRDRLAEFRSLIQKKMCRFWSGPTDLGSQVSRSLVQLIKTNPAVGWVRGDLVASASATEEILSLKRTIEDLRAEMEQNKITPPESSETLSQGEDNFEIIYTYIASKDGYRVGSTRYSGATQTDWDMIFYELGPHMLHEATDTLLISEMNRFLTGWCDHEIRKTPARQKQHLLDFEISQDSYQTIVIQLRSLGMITRSSRARSVKDNRSYWTLTPYGDNYLTRLRAIKKSQKL